MAVPTDARLMHRARERLLRLAQHLGIELRQSYVRVGKMTKGDPDTPTRRRAPCREERLPWGTLLLTAQDR